MTDLRAITKLCEDVTTGRVDPDAARAAAQEQLELDADQCHRQASWARSNFDPKRHLVKLAWSPFTQLEASIMALEAHLTVKARYQR